MDYAALPAEQRGPLTALFYVLTRMSREAVFLFFVLSGFLVGGPLIDRVCSNSFKAADYWLDRATRILIPLVPALGFTAVTAMFTNQPAGAGLFFANLFSLQGVLAGQYGGNFPLWTLSLEVWIYILAGSLASIIAGRRWSPALVVLLLSASAVLSHLPVTYLFCWLIGASAWRSRRLKSSQPALLLGAVLVVAGIAGVQLQRETQIESVTMFRSWCPDPQMMFLVLSVGFALLLQQFVLKTPRHAVLVRVEGQGGVLAASSYTLYLTHYPLLMLLVKLGWPRAEKIDVTSIASFTGVVLVCFAVTWLSYFCFESRTSVVRHWLRSRLGQKA